MSIDGNEESSSSSVKEEPIDMAERTLKWQHLAPTAPDTLGMYYYYFFFNF